jgi:hypothetical protein
VMGGQGLGVFSTGTYGSVTSYNDVGEGGFTLPGLSFFFPFVFLSQKTLSLLLC